MVAVAGYFSLHETVSGPSLVAIVLARAGQLVSLLAPIRDIRRSVLCTSTRRSSLAGGTRRSMHDAMVIAPQELARRLLGIAA